jgi:Uma2 family endonuclease
VRRVRTQPAGGSTELDEYGHVLMSSSPSARRQIVRADLFCQITGQIGPLAVMSTAVTTRSFGIRVPDVVWMSSERWNTFERDDSMPFVPNLCVEVLLDDDRQRDIARRIKAYLDSGAREVIVVSPSGQIELWGASGLQQVSMFEITLSLDRIYFYPDS